MSIKKDNVNVTAVKYNSQDVNKVILDNKCVWCKPFTYTQGTLPTGVASLTCTRSSTDEPTASTGTIANGGTIYYDDKLYWAATASAGYRITAIKGSNSPVTVSGAITGTTASGLTSARISGTISQGTLPTGVASITCYRKAYNENSFSKYTGSTIYYGDQFYWTATATTGYNNPSLTYNSSSKVYTWNGSQGGSITSVSASGLSAGSRKSFTISFGTTANKSLYGSWSKSSQTAYYGDKITVSGTTVTCYKWEATSTARWTVTVSSYSNTAEYTYSAVTIAESSITSVTAAATFTAYNTRTLNSYTITWKYLSAYPDTWTTATESYSYGATPSRTVSNVTSGNARKVPTGWDNLAAVTGNRTITANYKTQVNATFSGTRCYAKIDNVTVSNGWHDSGKAIVWTANTNCAFSSDGSTTTKSGGNISTQTTSYTASADYVNVTKLTGTNCSTNFTTGWKSITDKITWTAGTAYAFDTSNTTTSQPIAVVPGENKYTASYVKRYTLTISATNASYGTYSVSRTKSPYQGATTGALSNGATIFYGDVLTGTSSAKAVSYDGWSVTSVTAPTATTTGDATSGNLTITNKSSYQATLYYNTSNAAGGTSAGTAAANGSKTVTGLSFNTQYYISARVSRTRTKHTYATDGTQYSGTNGVTGNVTATFKFKDTTSTDTGTIDSSVVAAKTAAQNQYTITWKYLSAYPDTWTTATQTYNYGATPSRSNPNTVTSDSFRKVFTSWDSLATVTGNRTITANYKTQVNATFSGTRCSAKIDNVAVSNNWYDVNKIVTWTANPNCAFSSDGSTTTTTDTISTQKTNYTASANYVNVTKLTGTNCEPNIAIGWKSINDTITWTAGPAYAFDTSNTTSKSVAVVPGENKYAASYVKRYTLTISATNASYGTYSVSRNSSPYQGASTGTLNSGDTIYYGDVLGSKYSPKQEASYGDWNIDSIAAPTFTTTGDETSGNLTIKNEAAQSAVLYYNTSNAVGGTRIAEVDANAIKIVTGLEFNKQYYISARGTRTRTKYTYDIVVGEQYLGTECVTGDVEATFAFKAIPTTVSGSIDSAVVPAKTAVQNKYTVTFSITSGQYGSWGTTSIANVPYGTAITRSGNKVTVGSIGSSTFSSPSPDGPYNYASSTYSFPNRVTGATSVTGGCTRSVKQYTLTITKNNHVFGIKAWRTDSPYQKAAISSRANPLINGTGTATIYYGDSLAMEASANQYYHLSESGSKTVTNVTGDVSWAPTAIVNNYPVKIAAGDGINDVYLSSSSTATSGSPSGTEFPFGSTVHAFAQLIHSLVPAIIVPSGWVRVDSSGSQIYRVDSKQLNPSWNLDFGTINAGLRSYAVTIKGSEGINSVFLSTNPDATSGSPSGTTFKATTTVYAFAAVHPQHVYRVDESKWTKIGTSGSSTVYRVGSTYVATSAYNFGTITLPAIYMVTVSSDLIGLSSAYLSTSSTATAGSTSWKVHSGTTIYGFAVLNSYKSASICTDWTLIRGTANAPGAIYRVGPKKITATTTYNINLFTKSDHSAVVFKHSGSATGSWTINNHKIQSVSGTSKIWYTGTSIYAKYDDYNGSEKTLLLGKFTVPAGFRVTFTLTDYTGKKVLWNRQISLAGPYVVTADVEQDTTTT